MAKKLSLILLIGISSLLPVHAVPPPIAFGVWDRGSSFDPKDYPFLKGLAFNAGNEIAQVILAACTKHRVTPESLLNEVSQSMLALD